MIVAALGRILAQLTDAYIYKVLYFSFKGHEQTILERTYTPSNLSWELTANNVQDTVIPMQEILFGYSQLNILKNS